MIYKKPILHCFASPSKKLSCQDGSGASASSNPSTCSNGPINNPSGMNCSSGGLPTKACLNGTEAGTYDFDTTCAVGENAVEACGNGLRADIAVSFDACQSGIDVIWT